MNVKKKCGDASFLKEKRIPSDQDVTLIRLINDGYYPMVQVIKSFDKKKKMIIFSMWDDLSFEGIIIESKVMSESKEFEVEIDIQDPLYLHFDKLLGSDEEIVIDDDHTLGYNIKTLKISRGIKGIKITFKNNEEKTEKRLSFNVFIKNIMIDGRSKLFGRDEIKKRLVEFFNGIRESFLEKCI